MAKKQNRIVYEKLMPYAEKNLAKIEVQAGEYIGNNMCHHNARQRLEARKSDTAIAVLNFMPKSGVRVHFINREGDRLVDNTLGYLSKFNIYFQIKEYTLKELKKLDTHRSCMYDLLPKIKEEILNSVFSKKELKDLKITTEFI